MNNVAEVSAAARRARAGAAPLRLALCAAAALLSFAAISGCSSSSQAPAAQKAGAAGAAGGAAATPAVPAAISASATAPASPATNPVQAAAPAAPATGPLPCPTRYLREKMGVAQGTPGSTYAVIDFTNIGNVTCTLYGFPGVSFAGGTPVSQIGLAAAENHATARTLVTLPPGAVANALVQIVHAANFPAAKCGPVTSAYLQIYPPNQTTPSYLAYTSPACAKPVGLLTVSVVEPGAGSSS